MYVRAAERGARRPEDPGAGRRPRGLPLLTRFALANGAALAAFALSAVVQYNDPDPWGWVAVYLAAAGVCVLATAGSRATRSAAAVVGLVALAWAATMAPGVFAQARFADVFGRMHETRPAVEETREMLGLLLVAGWMGALALWPPRLDRAGPAR